MSIHIVLEWGLTDPNNGSVNDKLTATEPCPPNSPNGFVKQTITGSGNASAALSEAHLTVNFSTGTYNFWGGMGLDVATTSSLNCDNSTSTSSGPFLLDPIIPEYPSLALPASPQPLSGTVTLQAPASAGAVVSWTLSYNLARSRSPTLIVAHSETARPSRSQRLRPRE